MRPQHLPESTSRVVDGARKKGLPLHPGLEMTKLVQWKDDRKLEPDRQGALQKVLQSLSLPTSKELATRWRERRGAWLDRAGERALRLEVETKSPCVLWLAASSPLELGFCLHHTYGVPYLPGSALKGLARRRCLEKNGGNSKAPDPETLRLFGEGGEKGRAGLVDFLDGIPLDADCLEREVMTPHHHAYYAGSEPTPHDCEGPVPLEFLRIRPGAVFEIALLGRTETANAELGRARELLLEALGDLGLGAKTSSGYGIFVAASAGKRAAATADAQATAKGQPAPRMGRREVTARVQRFDKSHVFFVDESGNEFSLELRELERRFQMSPRRWNEFRKSGDRFRIVYVGDRVDSIERLRPS